MAARAARVTARSIAGADLQFGVPDRRWFPATASA